MSNMELNQVYLHVQSARDKLREVETKGAIEQANLRAIDTLLKTAERSLFIVCNNQEPSG